MLVMSKKDGKVLFRADDARLIEALDAYADSVRRSRNMAINILLEEALASHGFWPPQPVEPPTGGDEPQEPPKRGKKK
jgi:hypothetical protein